MALYTSQVWTHTQRASGRGTGVGSGRHPVTLEGILTWEMAQLGESGKAINFSSPLTP